MHSSPHFRIVVLLATITLSFLMLPLVVAFPVSLTPANHLTIPSWSELSLVHYESFLAPSRRWLSAVMDSAVVALGTAVVAVFIGTAFAIGVWRLASPLAEMCLGFALLPLVVPAVILAIGDYRVFAGIGLLDSYLGVIAAHTVLAIPFVIVAVLGALATFDITIERAASNLGASPARFIWDILLPSIRPGVIAGGLLAFIVSWDELVLSIFLTGRNVYTLPRRMWEALYDNTDPVIAVVSSLLILMTFAAIVPRLLWIRSRKGSQV